MATPCPTTPHPSADEEWLDHRVESWVETYKKSMLTPVILALVAEHQPAGVAVVAEAVRTATDWTITERGLYRTLKRLEDSELLATDQVDAPRTGAKRKEFSLTALGEGLLAGIRAHLIDVPDPWQQRDVAFERNGLNPRAEE